MYKKISAVLFPIMTVLLVVATVWGYQQHTKKEAMLIKAENHYQRVFHDLAYHVDKIHSELGKTLVVSSSSQAMHRKGLMNIWALASEAQNELNQLPLAMLPVKKTEQLISRVGKSTYYAAQSDLRNQSITDKEVKTLTALYKQSGEMAQHLQQLEAEVLKNPLKWIEVESAMSKGDQFQATTLTTGFQTLDKKVSDYDQLDWGSSIESMYDISPSEMKYGMPYSEQQIKQKVQKLIGVQAKNMQVQKNGKKEEWQTYSVTIDEDPKRQLSLDFTNKGGQLIMYRDNREIGNKKISSEVAVNKTKRFLESRGYKNMKVIRYNEHDNMSTVICLPEQNGILLWPQKIVVQLALDNGDVIGLQANDYVYENKNRPTLFQKPKISMAEARKKLNPAFQVLHMRRVIFKNELNQEVRCYEFIGLFNGVKYRICVNDNNGTEECVEEIRQ